MGDPMSRRQNQMWRLRERLKKKREALADFFEFQVYVAFVFEDPKRGTALFKADNVVPVMTNDYEDKIMKGAKKQIYSYASSQELLDQDFVQLHVPRYASMRRDVIGTAQDVDFFLWPRPDIVCVRCFVFSRWKERVHDPFRLVQADFMFFASDYKMQLKTLTTPKESAPPSDISESDKVDDHHGDDVDPFPNESGSVSKVDRLRGSEVITGPCLRGGRNIILHNPDQSLFFFVRSQRSAMDKPVVIKLQGLCLNLPQDRLFSWGISSVDEVLRPFMT